MSIASRLTFNPRTFFLAILLVGVLSLAFHINLGYYDLFLDNRITISSPEYNGHDLRLARENDVKVFGRSLRQHDVKTSGGKDYGQTENNSNLGHRLRKLEDRLLSARDRPAVVLARKGKYHHADHTGSDSHVVTVSPTGKLHWVDERTIVQGNWSVLLCLGDMECIKIQPEVGQKVSQIAELLAVSQRPDFLCTVANIEQKRAGRWEDVCKSHYGGVEDLPTPSLVVSSGETPMYATEQMKIAVEKMSFGRDVVVWPMQSTPIALHNGKQLLTVRILVASLSPLRFYVHQMLRLGNFASGKIYTNSSIQASVETLLQSISELYGLGTASRWWRNLQSLLTTFMLHLENELVPVVYDTTRCGQCFHLLDLSIMCKTVQTCNIVQINEGNRLSPGEVDSVTHLTQYSIGVSDDVTSALKHAHTCCNSQDCMGMNDDSVLTDDLLVYLLSWRQEMKKFTDWMQMYPGGRESTYVNAIVHATSWDSRKTSQVHNTLVDVAAFFNGLDSSSRTDAHYIAEESDGRSYTPSRHEYIGSRHNCSNDETSAAGLVDTIETYPKMSVTQLDDRHYNLTVSYHVIMLRVRASTRCCSCVVRLGSKYNDPGALNFTLGLGDTPIYIYVENGTNAFVGMAVLTVHRLDSGSHMTVKSGDVVENSDHVMCGLKQDCSLPYDKTSPCGLQEVATQQQNTHNCNHGDAPGQWVVPCSSCRSYNACDWSLASWQPIGCSYHVISPPRLKQCLAGKTLLFIGDSTNRGVANFIIQNINETLYDWDKTHSIKVYGNVNNNKTQMMFAYYPHFWLPVNHRPSFKKVLYQLIKSALPLKNSSDTILLVGGVHWLVKQHVDLIVEALHRKGLSGITTIVKGLGAGFHLPVEGVRYVPPAEQASLSGREREILEYAKSRDFRVVATFNMTMARYKDFTEGKCACHFHKVVRVDESDSRYRVDGEINKSYSQILLNQMCRS